MSSRGVVDGAVCGGDYQSVFWQREALVLAVARISNRRTRPVPRLNMVDRAPVGLGWMGGIRGGFDHYSVWFVGTKWWWFVVGEDRIPRNMLAE